MAVHPLGFIFVNFVNLQNERRNLLISGNDTFKDVLVVTGVALLQYVLCGYVVLKDPFYREDKFCNYVVFNQ